jgi:hypothetical protein
MPINRNWRLFVVTLRVSFYNPHNRCTFKSLGTVEKTTNFFVVVVVESLVMYSRLPWIL